jgi:hypothetical protein
MPQIFLDTFYNTLVISIVDCDERFEYSSRNAFLQVCFLLEIALFYAPACKNIETRTFKCH